MPKHMRRKQLEFKKTPPGELIIGLMSGTSVDGIDASLVSFESASKLTVIANEFTPFSDELRALINQTAHNSSGLYQCEDSDLHSTLAIYYAQASLSLVKKAQVPVQQISAIANHGQTVRHEPNAETPFSLQLGNPKLIAKHTGIRTIGQFRQADLAVGGQGAPLMPAFHKAVLGREGALDQDSTLVLNIGGIANITRLSEPVIGFDTGPGNTLLDQWIEHHLNKNYDANGDWARDGQVINSVLDSLLADPYFNSPFPKSTGTDYFNLTWLNQRIKELDKLRAQDIQATLAVFSVATIALGLSQIGAENGQLYVCGGGVHNSMLMEQLKLALPKFTIKPTDELGVPSDWVEAVGFAWLGYCCLHDLSSNLPSVTGASQNVVLGEIFHPE